MNSFQLQLILETTTEGFWDWDLKNDQIYPSPRYCELIGYSPDDTEFDTNLLRRIVHPDDRQRVFQEIQELLQGSRQAHNTEHRIIFRDGSVHWLQVRCRIIEHDEQGQPSRMVGTIIDISERKQMEQRLRLSEEKFRSLVETTSDCIWEFDSQGRFTYLSPKCQDYLGYPPEAFIGRTPVDLLPEDERQQWLETFSAIVAAQQPFSLIQANIRHRDGRQLIVEVSGVPVLNSEGEFLGMRGITRDITERKEAEKRLSDSQQQNEILGNILKISSQSFAVAYPDGRLGLCNPAFERLTGYTGDELKTIDWIKTLTAPEWHKLEQQKLLELDRTGQPVQYEKEYIRKDGSRVAIELLVHLVTNSEGNPVYYYGFLNDITDRKRMEQERGQLIAQLQEALANVKQLSGLLPICASCKKIKDDQGYWQKIESYIRNHTDAEFTHGYCPTCAAKVLEEINQMKSKEVRSTDPTHNTENSPAPPMTVIKKEE